MGPLEVTGTDGPVAAGGPRQRLVLALLIARANRLVQVDELIDDLWGDRVPRHPRKTVQVYVSNLRRALSPDHGIETVGSSYRLRAGPDDVDAIVFESLVDRARSQADTAPAVAHRLFLRAEALWRGRAYADLVDAPALVSTVASLHEQRATALEDRIELGMRLGRTHDAVVELTDLVREHPLREHAWALLMRALYLSGRQADALASYQRARRLLVDEVGVEPGPELADMERRVLEHDPGLGTPAEPRPAAAGPTHRASHRLVTAVCCAAAGTDALADTWEPTDAIELIRRFRAAVARVLVDHGALVVPAALPVVVGYFGLTGDGRTAVDAVVAALDVVVVAAAVRLDGLPSPPPTWGAQVGAATGVTAVDGGPPGTRRAATPPPGPVVARADRLRLAARPGQVLVSPGTAALVRGRIGLGVAADRRAGGGDGPLIGIPAVPLVRHGREP